MVISKVVLKNFVRFNFMPQCSRERRKSDRQQKSGREALVRFYFSYADSASGWAVR